MVFNCVHTFTLEAASEQEFDEKIERYKKLVHSASERLEIGYRRGMVTGRPAPSYERETTDKPLETLFDE